MRSYALAFGGGLALATGLAACSKPAPQAPPPSEVSVLTVAPATVDDNLDFVGDVQAYRTVQVRAQATGVIVQRYFTEGAAVQAGQVLYRIDPTNNDADWRGARARLLEAQARLSNAETNANRLKPLLEGNAVAKQDVDNANSQVEQARAAVDDAKAGLDRAKKGLDETTVRAEIGGRVGRALLDVGTRVTGSADILTTIDVLDPIYVSFRPSAQQQYAWRTDADARKAIAVGGSARVQAVLPDGSIFPRAGKIGFIDPVVDPQTGTQQYRAEFANPEHILLPGQFVHVKVAGIRRGNAVLIPQRAVLQQMGRSVVLVVAAGDSVVPRDVKATSWSGASWLIEDGLKAGDRVIVDGVQKARPGSVVKPVPYVDSAAVAAGASSAAASAASPAVATTGTKK